MEKAISYPQICVDLAGFFCVSIKYFSLSLFQKLFYQWNRIKTIKHVVKLNSLTSLPITTNNRNEYMVSPLIAVSQPRSGCPKRECVLHLRKGTL